MSEDRTNPVSSQEELMRRLKAIGADLWGNLPNGGTPYSAAGTEEDEDTGTARNGESRNGNQAAGDKKQPETAKRESRAEAGLDRLWVTADETVEWTEALLWDTPRDGLTSQKKWSFYHRLAPRVLAGDTEAYAEVLTTLNPLGDLTEYVSGMVLRTPDQERVECAFECQEDDLRKRGRDYLGALSLRIARDLMAALPVSEVKVTGRMNQEEKVNVTFRREQLLKKKMAFLVPADFVEECGGRIQP